jgi:hypothetical protein
MVWHTNYWYTCVRTDLVGTTVCTYTCTMVPYVRTYVRTYNVMSQLSDWKRAHLMCTENHVCTMVPGTMVPWYHGTSTTTIGRLVPLVEYLVRGTRVPYGTNGTLRGLWWRSALCRVGTVVYRDVFYAGTPTSFPVAPECLYFKSFLSYHGNVCTNVRYVRTYVRAYVRTYNVMSQLSDWKRAHLTHVH